MRAIGSPQKTSAMPKATARRRPPSAIAADRTDQAADAESGGHVADRLSARVEHLERCDDDQDVQAAADERLSGDRARRRSRRRGSRAIAPKPGRKGSARASPSARDQADPALDRDPRGAGTPPREAPPRQRRRRRPASATETSTPATSGPTSVPRLSIVDVAPFDAISSSGVRASEGSNACSAGRMSVTANPSNGSEREHERIRRLRRRRRPTRRAQQTPTSVIARRKRSRRKRSPSDAANGATIAAGSRRTSPAMPTAAGPPAS